MFAHLHVCVCVCVHVYIHMRVFVHLRVCVYVYVCACMCTYVCMCVCVIRFSGMLDLTEYSQVEWLWLSNESNSDLPFCVPDVRNTSCWVCTVLRTGVFMSWVDKSLNCIDH